MINHGGEASVTATLWIALGAIAAALIAREVKISEFRQAWIDGIRADISQYISKAHEWIDLYLCFNAQDSQEKRREMEPQLERLKYESLHILRRIELRFKPGDEPADALVKSLKGLLDPQKVPPPSAEYKWNELADSTVADARSLLKEEWEITKNPLRKLRSLWRSP